MIIDSIVIPIKNKYNLDGMKILKNNILVIFEIELREN
jgi:hypothetical protein